ncbi:hypothetical protein IIV22_109L [Invertebrate iridescent virus 22]|uniref:RING-type domain-containing protein n=1 Tax=Invertebrate iridescent virus 22 TaxID=345198 RepID=S6DAY9_9VIRU|nr:hypothetical protein IIV22_109L [Invertebrate iridescent virus 22]CCV01786.1 hypothetical protein IIV22_109L [Invertebrate iridescent virus 22]
MFKNSLWDDSSIIKHENYTLNNELNKLKKTYKLMVQEKKELERKINEITKVTIKLPEEIDKVLEKVPLNLQNSLYQKIEILLNCTTCIVCHSSVKRVVFIGCKHLVVCIKCGEKLSNCPLCRQSSEKITVFT